MQDALVLSLLCTKCTPICFCSYLIDSGVGEAGHFPSGKHFFF